LFLFIFLFYFKKIGSEGAIWTKKQKAENKGIKQEKE